MLIGEKDIIFIPKPKNDMAYFDLSQSFLPDLNEKIYDNKDIMLH